MNKPVRFACSGHPQQYYVLYPNLDDFASTTLENYNARIQDARKIAHYRRSSGFVSMEDCMEYIKRESMRLNDPVCEIGIMR